MASGGSGLLSWTIVLLVLSSHSGPTPKARPSPAASCDRWADGPQLPGWRTTGVPCSAGQRAGLHPYWGGRPALGWAVAWMAAAGTATSPMVASADPIAWAAATRAYASCSTGKGSPRLYGCGPATFQGTTGGATISSSGRPSSGNSSQDSDADLQGRRTKDRCAVQYSHGTAQYSYGTVQYSTAR